MVQGHGKSFLQSRAQVSASVSTYLSTRIGVVSISASERHWKGR